MAKLPSLLVTLLIVGAFFEGNALKCYEGDFSNSKGAKAMEPKLVDCFRNEDVCLSFYAKTDLYSEDGLRKLTAGTWFKYCDYFPANRVSEEFGHGASDRCIESKRFLKSGKLVACICSSDGCNQQIELEVDPAQD